MANPKTGWIQAAGNVLLGSRSRSRATDVARPNDVDELSSRYKGEAPPEPWRVGRPEGQDRVFLPRLGRSLALPLRLALPA